MRLAKWVTASMIVLALTSALHGDVLDQLRAMQEPRPVRPEPIPLRASDIFSAGQRRLSINEISELPPNFRQAIVEAGCGFESRSTMPGELVRVAAGRQDRVYAVLPCFRSGEYQTLYLLTPRGRVEAVPLPVVDGTGGIISTSAPGHMEWDVEAAILTVVVGSDLLPSTEFRHRYELRGLLPMSSLALVRVEKRLKETLPAGTWQKVWEAPEWGTPR